MIMKWWNLDSSRVKKALRTHKEGTSTATRWPVQTHYGHPSHGQPHSPKSPYQHLILFVWFQI